MKSSDSSFADSPKRIDLHCHSRASTEADEALLGAIQCPESYSEPDEIYRQARQRGMDWVTITDHDSISGVAEILNRPDVLAGEELTCWFPEDRCKMHVLVWGIGRAEHEALQTLAADIYQVANYIERNRIAHAVAHPLYRQNGILDRWHIEQLVLLFQGFEILNGAHSMLHREVFEPLVDELTEAGIRKLQRTHRLQPLWPQPWIKARTAGSDDHGLFNIGKTWTEFPAEVTTIAGALESIRTATCRPGGEAGSSLKLAHGFFGVGMRYYTRQLAGDKSGSKVSMVKRILGESTEGGKRGDRIGLMKQAAGFAARRIVSKTKKVLGLQKPKTGTALLGELFLDSVTKRIGNHAGLMEAIKSGRSPLAEHEPMFGLLSDISRDVAQGVADTVVKNLRDGDLGGLFDLLSPVVAQQAFLSPYYFALFHQNQERHLLGKITGQGRPMNARTIRVGVFTDSMETGNPAGRFAVQFAAFGQARQLELVTHTCMPGKVNGGKSNGGKSVEGWRNFQPLAHRAISGWETDLIIPPVLEMLEWADRRQFDAIVVNTAGPVGLCGWIASRMLRVPMIASFFRDIPATVFGQTGGDYRTTGATRAYISWFYGQAARILTPSRAGRDAVAQLLPGRRDGACIIGPSLMPEPTPQSASGPRPLRILLPGGLTHRDDMQLAVTAFEHVLNHRDDVRLVVAGEGAWVNWLKNRARRLPVEYVGEFISKHLQTIASADLLLYPCRNDVSGQVALDAQSLGIPVLAGQGSAAAEWIDDELTGRVLPMDDAKRWGQAMVQLLADESQRQRMARTARQRVGRLISPSAMSMAWDQCLAAIHAAIVPGAAPARTGDDQLAEVSS